MKMFNAKAIFCTETQELVELMIGNKNNLSNKRKVEFNKLQKEIKYKFSAKTS